MKAEWIKSPTARRILAHWADSRPAWLWSQDGARLLWRNQAARFFHGRVKKHGVKLAPDAVPIKGQIARLIRLGSPGRSSLSRIQFLAGDRPISTTCTSTPLELASGQMGLLLVGVDAIEPELLEAPGRLSHDSLATRLFPSGAEYLLVDDDGQIRAGSPVAIANYAPILESEGLPDLPDGGSGAVDINGQQAILTRYVASPQDATLLLFEPETVVRAAQPMPPAPRAAPSPDEPLLPIGLPPAPTAPAGKPATSDEWAEPFRPPELALSSLFDRLADDAGLYTPLTESDAVFVAPRAVDVDQQVVTDTTSEPLTPYADEFSATEPAMAQSRPAGETDNKISAEENSTAGLSGASVPQPEAPFAEPVEAPPDVIAAVIAFSDDPETGDNAAEGPVAWRIIGRGFIAAEAPAVDAQNGVPDTERMPMPDAEPDQVNSAPLFVDTGGAQDTGAVDRVSRYNFDELSRILTDRISGDTRPRSEPLPEAPVEIETPMAPAARAMAAGEAVINPNAETFVLNRLPLGILVFRDQQVLFANRALTDLTGHESVERLRAGGIAAIFPNEDGAGAGPVTRLVRRDGSTLPVSARLQSISWQGRPALMLCASPVVNHLGHEAAVKNFAELMAESHAEGFVATDRAGIVTRASTLACVLFELGEAELIGKPLAGLVASSDVKPLRDFLEQAARFAETTRPHLSAVLRGSGHDLVLFAEGQAGVVSGYFGLVRRQPGTAAGIAPASDGGAVEASVLARLSRSVRRPLNTIIGFADLIQSAAFGSIENQRYLDYARDIKTSGQEISVLVDELDDFTRLKEGRYPARLADVDLWALLESCMVRVRSQAGAGRVLVRSAISEQLPRIHADRASLGQAVLNLLASAIDQTPPGGSVILSAQLEDDGGIGIHVRDGATSAADLGERFVVFRDGLGRDGEVLMPVRSSVGLALTRSLLAVNTCSLSVDPTGGVGTLFSLVIPAELIVGV